MTSVEPVSALSPYDPSWVDLSLLNISHIKSPSVLLVGEPRLRMVCEAVNVDGILQLI